MANAAAYPAFAMSPGRKKSSARPLRVATNAAKATPIRPEIACRGVSRLASRTTVSTSARPTATIAATSVFWPETV
jgi:hypothetical protein